MQIYSQEILKFNNSCEKYLKEIISNEMGLDVGRSRFLFSGYYFPIKVQSYQDERELKKTTLAYFDSRTYKILINFNYAKRLNKELLLNLLRHEMAHYIIFIKFGHNVDPHGQEFKSFCSAHGWGDEVASPLIEEAEINKEEENTKKKFQKLMALTQSDNEHEALLALEKAQSLMLDFEFSADEEKIYYLKVLDHAKRKNSKLQAIYEILETMNIAVVFHYTSSNLQFETYGNWEQINQAMDIFQYLNYSLDQIWNSQKNLKGISSKNSFFQGFSHGVCIQLKEQQKKYPTEIKKALIIYKQELKMAEALVYPKLSRTYSRTHVNHTAYNQGFQNGQEFNTQYEKHRYLSQ